MSTHILWNFSEAYGMQSFYQQTQEWIHARMNSQQDASQLDQPIMDGDVLTMAVKFERSVLLWNMYYIQVGGFKTQNLFAIGLIFGVWV